MTAQRTRRRSSRAQAMTEFTLTLPLVVLLSMGGTDLGRAWQTHVAVTSAANQGVATAAQSATSDIGSVVRTQNTAMPDDLTTWGSLASGDCSATCGDQHGCTPASSFWTSAQAGHPQPVACFAIQSCTIDTSPTSTNTGQCTTIQGCTSATGGWGSRPAAGSAAASTPCLNAIQVTVVYRFTPMTPLIANYFSNTSNMLFITTTATALELY